MPQITDDSPEEHTVNETQSPWMSKQEAAAYLGVTDWSVDRYVKQNKLPRYRLAGGQARFKRMDVEALIELDQNTELLDDGVEPDA